MIIKRIVKAKKSKIIFSGIFGVILGLVLGLFPFFAHSGNIDTNNQGYHWAWNDVIGWINFRANDTVEVLNGELRGWAGSNIGPIVLNCATTPNGDVCAQSNFRVVNNAGALSGWAWNDVIGWIRFRGANYGVTIEPSGNGQDSFFKGWAWNDIIGWISFHCENNNLCATFPTYKIQTPAGNSAISGSLESNVFDTGVDDPVYNYIMWQGKAKTNTTVELQVASSDSPNGPWNFSAPVAAAVGRKVPIGSAHQNHRYIKYKVTITANNWSAESPIIEDVIINYSP